MFSLLGSGLAMAQAGAVAQPPHPEPSRPNTPASVVAEQDPRFDILEFEVDGNSVLNAIAIERAVTPFLGPNRSMKDVEDARVALEKVYQGAGFLTVFVDVPEQRVDGGVVRLKVIEGRVERLSVTGSRYFSQGYIREKVPEFAAGQVPNFNEAQRQLALVNRTEERRVQPVLKPGRAPGAVEVDLKVSDELPLSGSVELNNNHAADTEPLRLAASLRYDNLFQRDHSVAVNIVTAPQAPRQSSVLVVNYAVPMDSGNSVVAYGVVSNSTVDTLGGTTVLGDGTTLGLRYVLPFFGSDASAGYHSLTFGADYKDLKERVNFGTGSLSTPLRYLPLQLAYSGQWQGDGASTQLSATFVGAMRRVLQRKVDCPGTIGPVDQFACKRQGADGGFATLRLDGRHTEPWWWGTSLALRLAGQVATQQLVSSEQFSIGGAESVRGYLEGAASGDYGALASLEWRSANLVPGFKRLFSDDPAAGATGAAGAPSGLLNEVVLLSFVDAARAYTIDPAVGQAGRVPLLSAGVGLRVGGRGGLSAGVEVAWPHRRTARQADDDPRVHARVGLKF